MTKVLTKCHKERLSIKCKTGAGGSTIAKLSHNIDNNQLGLPGKRTMVVMETNNE